MSEWDSFDFAVTHVKSDHEETVQALKGRVIEEGIIREVPIELAVPKAMEYLGYGGRFCVARDKNGEFIMGPEIVTDPEQTPPLTVAGDTEMSLSDLPEAS